MPRRVIIIGGGLAGLAAADTISKARPDWSIVVLEGRKRVGGRVCTKWLRNGVHLDIGGTWIAEKHTEMRRLCRRYKLSLSEQFYTKMTVKLEKRRRLSECVGYQEDELAAEPRKEVRRFVEDMDRLGEHMSLESPWTHPRAHELDAISVAEYIKAHMTNKTAIMEIMQFVEVVLACTAEQCSMLFFVFYVKSGGGMIALGDGTHGAQKWRVVEGAESVADRLYNDLHGRTNVSILFGRRATKVCYTDNKVEVYTKEGNVEGDFLICAVSPALMRRVKWDPELPPGKQELMAKMRTGHACKFFVAYDDPFWLRPPPRPQHAHIMDLGPVHNLYHMTVHIKGVEKPAIVGILAGTDAIRYEEMDEKKRRKAVLDQMVRMYEGRGYTEDRIRAPLLLEDVVWSTQPLSGGCYAGILPATGTFAKYGPFLRKPTGPLHWASTETATEFYGYMEGAVRSGRRVARELLRVRADAGRRP